MFEDAKIITVLGTVLRGEEAEQQEESSIRPWFRTGSPQHLLPKGDKKAPRHYSGQGHCYQPPLHAVLSLLQANVPFLMSLRTPTSICMPCAKYNSRQVFITIEEKNFRGKSVPHVISSIALELKQISFGLEIDINKLKESSQLRIQHMELGPCTCHVISVGFSRLV